MNKPTMTRVEILNVIESLAKSQGFYSRLLHNIHNEMDEETREAFLERLEKQNFTEPVDIVFFFES